MLSVDMLAGALPSVFAFTLNRLLWFKPENVENYTADSMLEAQITEHLSERL